MGWPIDAMKAVGIACRISMLTPVKAGAATNFDLSVRTQKRFCRLEFSGLWNSAGRCLQLLHDFGRRQPAICWGRHPFSVEILGKPPHRSHAKSLLSSPWKAKAPVGRSEGTVEFAGEKAEGGELELRVGNDRYARGRFR